MHRTSISPRAVTRILALVFLLVGGVATTAAAQDTSATMNLRPSSEQQIVTLTLVDGSTLIGRVREVTDTTIQFTSALGESTIPRSAVRSVTVADVSRVHDGQLWAEDPSRTRLLFAPTGRTLRRGEGYLADAYIFFPSVQVGLTDRVTLGGGLSLFPGVDIANQLFYLTPKVGVYASPTLNVSVGALIAGAGGLSDQSPAGIVYSVATLGSEDASVTTGLGVGFANKTHSDVRLLMLGGETRVSRSISLVTENYFSAGNSKGSLFSGGVRFIGDKLSVDLALFGGGSVKAAVPYVAFLYKF